MPSVVLLLVSARGGASPVVIPSRTIARARERGLQRHRQRQPCSQVSAKALFGGTADSRVTFVGRWYRDDAWCYPRSSLFHSAYVGDIGGLGGAPGRVPPRNAEVPPAHLGGWHCECDNTRRARRFLTLEYGLRVLAGSGGRGRLVGARAVPGWPGVRSGGAWGGPWPIDSVWWAADLIRSGITKPGRR